MNQALTSTGAARPAPVLTEHDNARAVDLIESAERSAPYCPCGRHMIAVADGGAIWLECSSRSREHAGLAGIISRLSSFSHTRRLIMELPAAS